MSPERRRANNAVRRAIRRGDLVRPVQCGRCDRQTEDISGHHHKGYAPEHELDVEWLCRRCHGQVHGRVLTLTREDLVRAGQSRWRDLTSQERSDTSRQLAQLLTADERRNKALRSAQAQTPDQRRLKALRGASAQTPEQRRMKALKGWETRRQRAAS